MTIRSIKKQILSLLLLLFLSSCATFPSLPQHPTSDHRVAFVLRTDDTRLARYAPVFVIENPAKGHNRIGTPTAGIDKNGEERIFVDPDRATLYGEERTFTTPRGHYTNLIYRLHFEEIPGGLNPYYLGKGKNVGLIVVVTLNSFDRPLLYTTVHTCGCYLAFIPTSSLPEESFSRGWKRRRQGVHAENLPGLLDLPPPSLATPPMILIRNATHRVKDLWIQSADELKGYRQLPIEIKPLASLRTLPLDRGGTTSFYETFGPRKGYVKGSQKIRERLLMGWWAFDWRIGEDKALEDSLDKGVAFYTSLKPWAKKASDMRDFTQFLSYWGWRF